MNCECGRVIPEPVIFGAVLNDELLRCSDCGYERRPEMGEAETTLRFIDGETDANRALQLLLSKNERQDVHDVLKRLATGLAGSLERMQADLDGRRRRVAHVTYLAYRRRWRMRRRPIARAETAVKAMLFSLRSAAHQPLVTDDDAEDEWNCEACECDLVDEAGRWRWPVYLVEEMRAPVDEDDERDAIAFCCPACIARFYKTLVEGRQEVSDP